MPNVANYFLNNDLSEIERNKFMLDKFITNNFKIFVLSVFLFFEQLFYAFVISESASLQRQLHFVTAIIMLVFAAVSLYLYYNPPEEMSVRYLLFESSIGVFGLLIAITRAVLIEQSLFLIPTIYIAVLYGMAVVFCYSYKQSFLIYFSTALLFIIALSYYRPEIVQSTYLSDIISNNLIAWLVAMINYNKQIRDFINRKIINANNKKLVEKNKNIAEINNKLKEVSITDQLTKLYNRRRIENVLQANYQRAKEDNTLFSIILLDLDHFKQVNDNFGHQIGDEVLVSISKLLENNSRDSDICGRWGGEEFIIICPNITLKACIELAERIRKLTAEYDFSPVEKLTASFGVAVYEEGRDISDLISTADKSMYKAKKNGRNQVQAIQELLTSSPPIPKVMDEDSSKKLTRLSTD